MLGETVAYPNHATLLSKSPATAIRTSNAQNKTNYLRTKKESWPSMLAEEPGLDHRVAAVPAARLALNLRSKQLAYLAKMPLLLFKPNCQRSFAVVLFPKQSLTRSQSTGPGLAKLGQAKKP
jgi:hypothetical protein